MADSKISALPSATTPLAGTELLPIVQGGATTKVAASAFQAPLVSGTNIKTVNSTSLLGSGDVAVQATLVSGTNIKTINSASILGSGDLTVSASAGGSNTQVQFNNSGALGGDAGLTYNSTTGGLTLGGKTVTTSNPVIDASQTWNAGAVTFTGIKFNVTDTSSATFGCNLLALQVNGTTAFYVDKRGGVAVAGYSGRSTRIGGIPSDSYSGSYRAASSMGFGVDDADKCFVGNANGLNLQPLYLSSVSFGSGALGANNDTILIRDAANTLAQRNGANAQTFRIYGTYTDASNYRRIAQTMSTAGVGEIKPEGAGTGASGNVLYLGTGSTTVASLVAASTAGAGARAFVTDATATTFLSTVAGGGANKVPVVSDGTNWLIG